MFIVFCIETMGGYNSPVDMGGLPFPWTEDIEEWGKVDDPAICDRGDIDQWMPEVCWALWSR